jgi:hypothetical protein
MRTTLTIDDDLARRLKQHALDTGRSFKDVVNEALRTGLDQAVGAPVQRPYRVERASLGRTAPGIDLDRATRLAGQLEDEEQLRKLELRK